MKNTRAARPRSFAREIPLLTAPGQEGVPLYQRLHRALRGHILSGRLSPGERLPSARTLAADLRLSRNTVEAAMAQLVDEGVIERRVGAGTVVSESVREAAPFAVAVSRAEPLAAGARARPSRRGATLLELGRDEFTRDADMGWCATNVRRFPVRAWTRLLARKSRASGHALLVPDHPLGLPELRREIARHASLARGLRCTADQVLVVGSTQEALDLAARVLLDPGDTAVIEDPGYLSAGAVFLGAGARLATVPVDRDGLVTAALPRRSRARLLYVTPSHQFPLGVTMSLARRLEVLRWAASRDAWVIEDDYDSEFLHDGRPIAALQSLPSGDRVLYVGTFNKVLFPGLRLAYLVLPPAWVEPFSAARRVIQGSWAPLPQAALAEFIAGGRLAGYLRQARHWYTRCRDAAVESMREHWGDAARLGPSATGLHVVAHLRAGVDDLALARAARRHGLPAVALSRYFRRERARRGLIVSYGAADPDALAASVRACAALVRKGRGAAAMVP